MRDMPIIERMFALAELHEELRSLAVDRAQPVDGDVRHHAATGHLEARAQAEHLASSRLPRQVAQLAHEVRQSLPWRSTTTGEPVGMDVVGAGLLDEDHDLYPSGTPYVTVAVDTWDAADAVRHALDEIAGLDEASWALDWSRVDPGFRTIRIFPAAD